MHEACLQTINVFKTVIFLHPLQIQICYWKNERGVVRFGMKTLRTNFWM